MEESVSMEEHENSHGKEHKQMDVVIGGYISILPNTHIGLPKRGQICHGKVVGREFLTLKLRLAGTLLR